MKRIVTIVFGLLLGGLCLWLFFRGVDSRALWSRLGEADPLLVSLLIASAVVHMVLRSWRWRTLLGPAGRDVSFWELFSAVSIGYMAVLLPGRISEVLRPTILARRTRVPLGTALATVAAERMALDLPMVLLFGALFLVLPSNLTGLSASADTKVLNLLRSSGVLLLAGALAALSTAVYLGRHQERISGWIENRARERGPFLRRLAGWVASLLPGLAAFGTFRSLGRLLLETLVLWGVIAAGIHSGVAACGVELAPLAALVIIPATAIGIAVPTPGGAGTYHMVMKVVLVGLFAANETAAVSAGLVAHGLPLLAVILLGAACALRGGLSAKKGSAPDVSEAQGVRP